MSQLIMASENECAKFLKSRLRAEEPSVLMRYY